MKTQNDIKKLEIKLDAILMSNDIKIGTPISKKQYSPLLGYEYDAVSHTISLVIPIALKTTLISLFKKQELENISQNEIMGESGYVRIIVYL